MQIVGPTRDRRLLTAAALVATALAIAFLFIGVGHSLIVLSTDGVGESSLAIDRGRWDLVVGSALIFLAFLALIPVRATGDWRSHGMYAAFIVSLFAEMFGFPLSAYFLSSVFGLTLFEREFMAYMYRIGMPLGSVITFGGILLIILGWRGVYRLKDRLATQGIYRHMRHPQYLGILLVTAGWLVHWPTVPSLIMWPILVFLYYRLAVREEGFLAEKFGWEYQAWAAGTPRFLPFVLRGTRP